VADLPRAGIAPHRIALAANRAAEVFAEHGWTWALPEDPTGRFIPTGADIALSIRRKVDDLTPGTRIDSGRIAVEWVDDAEHGPGEIRVWLHLGDLNEPGEEQE
jgi:hypothetical protein